MSHWPEAVDCTYFPFSPVLEVTQRAQVLFSVFTLMQNIVRQLDPSVNPARPLQNGHLDQRAYSEPSRKPSVTNPIKMD